RVLTQQGSHLPIEETVLEDQLQLAYVHRRHVLQRWGQVVPIPTGIHLADCLLEDSEDDLPLVTEVILQVALADPTACGDSIAGDASSAVFVEELQCTLQNS